MELREHWGAARVISGQQLGRMVSVLIIRLLWFTSCGSQDFIIGWQPRREVAGWFKRHHGPRQTVRAGQTLRCGGCF